MLDKLKPLPDTLKARYAEWKSTGYADKQELFARLASEGQEPRALVIACCDSRVQSTTIFGAEHGEFFVHRNIANLVPAYDPQTGFHGTPAAIEYAVTALEVPHVIVMGHSKCGGVQGCLDLCKGNAPQLNGTFVEAWLKILKPKFERVEGIQDVAAQIEAFEHLGILTSLENLMTYPFVAERVTADRLSLHGLHFDISDGTLKAYEPGENAFLPV